ncbi:MAG: PEP-CTERM sorting domain-containing protein, partial [Deltaproteobacteria bacterium]|nr:PEP-CTERM sorting domain-containing protein [Deltaproteobacteria bacterium]
MIKSDMFSPTNDIVGLDNVRLNPVPEPSTILLMGLGLLGLVGIKKARKKS